jgi:protoporphyrin/coproporphyrin ferrochelatase
VTSPTTGSASPVAADAAPYDALLLFSFGGPDEPDDIMPFLRNVTAGKGIPDARLAQVAEHYEHVGGRSPINGQNLALLAALRAELARRGLDLPVVWGNRNWAPYTRDALVELGELGATRVLAVVTSAYSSYSGCRQYREDLALTVGALEEELGRDLGIRFDKVRSYFNHPGFVAGNTDAVVEAFEQVRASGADLTATPLVFVTHSIPDTMEEASGAVRSSYREQHLDVAAVVAEQAGVRLGVELAWSLAYCSRSGPPSQPWLEPDVNDELRELSAAGTSGVVLAPIGFVSDHMEVVYDLDTEALETARELGLTAVRAATVGTHPAFVAGIVDLVLERAAAERGETPERAVVGRLGAVADVCLPGCCRQRAGVDSGVPALCGRD